MIKINLSNTGKPLDLSNIGGFDFTKLKFKALLLVIALIYVPDFVLVPYVWEPEKIEMETAVNEKQARLTKLKREVARSQEMEKQLKELKAQEENLEKKLTAVKQAISEKRNPAPILLYITKNMPPELWIKELEIDQGQMTIKGEALDYNSIGNFVNSLRSSVFIKDANISGTSSALRESDKRRIETFEVKFTIARFQQ